MKNFITLFFAGSLLISSTLALGQGKSKNKNKSDDISINRGQINSTLKKVEKLENSDLQDDLDNDEIDIDEDWEDTKSENSKLEKSLMRESRKAIKKAIK